LHHAKHVGASANIDCFIECERKLSDELEEEQGRWDWSLGQTHNCCGAYSIRLGIASFCCLQNPRKALVTMIVPYRDTNRTGV
jgi:hypothetical protein